MTDDQDHKRHAQAIVLQTAIDEGFATIVAGNMLASFHDTSDEAMEVAAEIAVRLRAKVSEAARRA